MADVLVVDDEAPSARFLSACLERAGHRVRCAEDGVRALSAIEERMPEIVVSDLRMPVMDGLELLARVKQRWQELPVLLLSVEDEARTIVQAVRRGAANYLVKPCPPERIRDAVDVTLRESELRRPKEASEIVGRSAAMTQVRHAVGLASRSDVNVLITGATGTGKELVSRSIHRLSARAEGPFVVHNCASTPAELFESVFFGHRRGAFTGAERDHEGLLCEADRGILFLDELEAMRLDQQAKLLRVIDDGEVRAVGAKRTRHVSVRFLAATNRDPCEMIREGSLRDDLFYRLRGFEIHLPPLRRRREDVLLLASSFLEPDVDLAPGALEALQAHDWPGNVRELKNVLRSARAASAGGRIEVEHLQLRSWPWDSIAGGLASPVLPTLKEVELTHIHAVLRSCGGNRSQAAKILGIDRSTLRRKLEPVDP